jgi:hypothetical protein
VKYAQDIVRNGFVAVALALVTTWIKQYQDATQARFGDLSRVLTKSGALELAVSGWSRHDGDAEPGELTPEKISALRREKEVWAGLAKRVDEIHLGKFMAIPGERIPLYLYVAEGSRERRLLYMARLADDFVGVEAAVDDRLATAVRLFRTRTLELAGCIHQTNTTIIERLLVEARVPLNRPLSGHQLRETTGLRDAAISHSPLYLLLVEMGELTMDPACIEAFAADVNRAFGALRNELSAAVRCAESVIELAEAALRLRAELPA